MVAVAAGKDRSPPSRAALSEQERHKVLREWNRTRADFPDACAHRLFEEQVARTPFATAVVFGDWHLTYREVNERANQVARLLRRRGVGPDSLIAVSLHRTPWMVIGLLGVWKAGAAYVPMDPTYPTERLAFMVEDAAVSALLADSKSMTLFPGIGGKLICLDGDQTVIEREDRDDPDAATTPSDLAYVIYTSGSTGKPKGALIEHRGLVNYLWWAIRAYGVECGGSVPLHSSISFDLTVTSLYPALLAGAKVELLPEDIGAQSLLAGLRRSGGRSLVKITPAHLELITQQVDAREAPGMTRAFVIGGENLTAESLRFWRECAPATRLINEYGPTETVVGCCIHEVGPEDPANGSVPIGRPISNMELYVLDAALEPVTVGATGELFIGGVGVGRGYLNRPELTRERFLPDPFSDRPGARLYKTGDLARYRSDGTLEYLGRIDDQVKVRGYRIELGEIEAALAGHPGVRSCTVVLREDVPGNKQLVGYVVPQKPEPPSADDLRRFLRERLPEYMVPAHVVMLESLPLTQNGKVDRKVLPAPTYFDASASHDYAAPRTATERSLAAIWSELLGLERVGVNDDVFDLGATSLLIMAAVARMRSEFGVAIELQLVFEKPTIVQMAAAFGPAGHDGRSGPPAAPAAEAAGAAAAFGSAAALRVDGGAPRSEETPTSAQRHLAPIRFGALGRELLGLYQAPPRDADRREFCLLCNPFGQEAVRSHRMYRIIADRLVRTGLHVMRFDYFGTGDSDGADVEANLDEWLDDVLRANDELMRRSSCTRGAWLGLRLGASVAALASQKAARPPDRLVLWDPIVDGSAYLDELAKAHVAARRDFFELRWEVDPGLRAQAAEEAQSEALGYPLPGELKEQLRGISPRSFQHVKVDRVVLLDPRPDAQAAPLCKQLAKDGIDVRSRKIESRVVWTLNQMLSDTVLLAEDLHTIAAALTEP